MTKTRTDHRCEACGAVSPTWLGRCPGCGEWNTLVAETAPARLTAAASVTPLHRPQPIAEIDPDACPLRSTGLGELDRVLGGGLVPGSVTLLGGEPGAGKSTLLLQAAAAMAEAGSRCLIVSAEESAHQVRRRAARLGAEAAELHLVAETDVDLVVTHIDDLAPDVVVVDSIQTLHDQAVASAPGSVAQVRHCAQRLVTEAKARSVAVLLVGHVTKEGTLAGPRALEHIVDTVLSLEGDRHHGLRLLRATKHRFGPTNVLGLFEMAEAGMVEVADASELFLADRQAGVPGSVVLPTIEGHRPLLVEVQALVSPTYLPQPRRLVQGLDAARLTMLVAVLHRRADISLATRDIHVSAVGGVRVVEPAADLAVALAIASGHSDRRLPADLVALGEVGLAGEVRQVSHLQHRLAEAARLGFRRAIVPRSAPDGPPGMTLARVGTVRQAVVAVGCGTILPLRPVPMDR